MLAGSLSDETGELMSGTGMIIFQAESEEDAKHFADSDPMHASGARTYTLHRWAVNEGRLQLSAGLASQSVKFL